MKHPRLTLVVAGAIMVGACSHAQSASATPRDRAACVQAAVAYVALNRWNGGPPPTSRYREAIQAADHDQSNPKLSDAISDWMTNLLQPSVARPGPDAGYTMEACRRIGVPLTFTAAPTRRPSSPSNTDAEGSDDD